MAHDGSPRMTLTFKAWHESGHRFLHHGYPIFFQSSGHGGSTDRALLCVHGYPTASWDWHKLWPRLSARFERVLAPDMLGFGWSAKPPDYRYSIADQADLHETLLREQGIAKVSILAHDYGDTVAQELLARHEERRARGDASLVIERCVFLNGGLFPETHRARPVQKLLVGPLGPALSRLISRKAFGRSFSTVFGAATQPGEAELDEFWQLLQHNRGNRLAHRLLHYIPERRRLRARWVGALVATDVPLRVINGPDDPVSGAHMVERYRQLVPRADVVSLPGIGHYPQVEDADGVWAGLDAFFPR